MHTRFTPTKLFSFLLACLLKVTTVSAQCGFTGLGPNYCAYSPTVQLTPTTAGGFFSGPGVSGNVFDPALAGPGTHTISYGLCSSSYSVSAGTYSPYSSSGSGGSGGGGGGGEGSSVLLGDDQVSSSSFPIGFNFTYFCNTYSTFYIGSNGFITFSSGQSQGCCSGQVLPNTASPNNMITLTWADWDPGAGGTITYTTVGVSPNRRLIVTFANVPHFATSIGILSAQLQLYETSNIIEVHTTSMVPNSSGHTMGIKDLTGANAYVVTGRNSTNTWTATTEMYRYTPMPGCISTQTTYVSPATVPVSGNNFVCFGSSTALTASANTSYTWSTGSNAAAVTLTPSSTTTYSVSGTNNFGCVANSAITVTVSTLLPTVTAVASNTTNGICPGNTLSLNASGALSYTWTGGVTNGAPISPSVSSTYTVTGANGCGTSTAAISVSIHPIPLVTASATSPSICSGASVSLIGGGANTYTWANSIVNGSAITPTLTNSYSVTGTSALGCTATAVTTVVVVLTPTLVPIAAPALMCIGSSATLTSSGASNYTWIPGNVTTASLVVTPTITTTYTLTKSNANCVNTRTLMVTVNQLPTVMAIAAPTLVCSLNTATLAAGGASTYTWTAPGFTTTGFSPIVSPLISTIYTLTASDGTCVNTTTVALAVDPNPTLSIVASSSVLCAGQSATLTVSGATNYSWTPASLSGSVVTVSPNAPSSYAVSGVNSFGCSSSVSQIVLVNPLPQVVAITNKTLVCANGAATLTATGSANSYSWSTGIISPTVMVNTPATTVYSVTGSNTLTGCSKTNTVLVSVFVPAFAASANTAVCIGGAITLTASGAVSYTWSTGVPFPSCVVSPTAPTVYTVSATSSSNNVSCISSTAIQVTISPNPTVTAVSNKTLVCKGDKAILTGLGAVTYTWSNAAVGTTVQISPSATTNYTVQGTDANGCLSTGTIQVKVSNCNGIDELNGTPDPGLVIYPNPSSGDFVIQSSGDLNLVLVNELGQIIMPVTLSASNNHTVQVKAIANGIYFITGTESNSAINKKIIVNK